MSVAELSRRSGIENKRLWYLLHGERNLKADELLRLCLSLEVPPRSLVPTELVEDVTKRKKAAEDEGKRPKMAK